MQNFRITSDNVLELYNSDTNDWHFWGVQGTPATLNIDSTASTRSTKTDWNGLIPFGEGVNYRLTTDNILQLLNKDTNNWHTFWIIGTSDNPSYVISKIGVK